MLFTAETATIAAYKSVDAKRRAKERPLVIPQPPQYSPADPFSDAIACACGEVLKELRQTEKPLAKAQLARCLRDLGEVWHLATGKPRPGLTRPEQYWASRRELPRTMPSGAVAANSSVYS
jgi:hypothetical protein